MFRESGIDPDTKYLFIVEVIDRSMAVDVDVSGRLGDVCSTNEDCITVLSHSSCDDVTLTCECDVSAGYGRQEDGTCDIR